MKESNLVQKHNTYLMEVNEDQTNENYAKQCRHCLKIHYYHTSRNILVYLYYVYGYNVTKWKNELRNISSKKTNFINRKKHAEHKMFCFCIDGYKIYQGKDYHKTTYTLSKSERNFKKTIS